MRQRTQWLIARRKMLVFEETGAIVAAPTFSLPEHIGGPRNWSEHAAYTRVASNAHVGTIASHGSGIQALRCML